MSAEQGRSLVVREKAIELPDGLDPRGTYDVLLNGQHVWSLQPQRDAQRGLGRNVVPWPRALRRHLVGRAEVTLREHVTKSVVGVGDHVFAGAVEAKVSVVDRAGNTLVIDKYGRLTLPLSAAEGDTATELMDQVEQLLDTLRDRAGVPAFLAYGTLLGAVRSGDFIGHDNDIDLAYVSEHRYPVDVIREGYRIERVLQDEGWLVRRGSGTRVNVRLFLADGSVRFVDVFTAHWVDDMLYMQSDTGFQIPRESIVPLTTVELRGRRLPAPADYERLLVATYGPDWRTPDPSFKYETPRWLARRLNGWFGGLRQNRKVWDAYYGGAGRQLTMERSPFAIWVEENYPSTRHLVDLGTGNGRDALWFARDQRRRVTALDYSIGVLRRSHRLAEKEGLAVDFGGLNFYDSREVLALGAALSREDEPVDLYGRFLLDSLEPDAQENLFRLASMSLRRGGLLFLEFRTKAGRSGRKKAFVRVNAARVARDIESHGGRVVYQESATGLAPFGDKDPMVCRMVATWASPQPA